MDTVWPVYGTGARINWIRVDEQGDGLKGVMEIHEQDRSRRLEWSAHRNGGGKWQVSGQGAYMRDGRRAANARDYPFSMDPLVNDGVKGILGEWLSS